MDKINSYFLFFVLCIVMFYDVKSAGMLKKDKNESSNATSSFQQYNKNMTSKMKDTPKFLSINSTSWTTKNAKYEPRALELLSQNSQNKTTNNYSYAILNKCDNSTCNPDVGYCLSNNMCACKEEFANFPMNKTETFYPNSACNYEKRKQVIAFLLEFFVPFGTSYFYLGRKEVGLLKVSVLFFIPLVLLIIFCHCCKSTSPINNKANSILFNTFSLIYLVGLIVWLFWDLINISLGKYTDVNGVSLSAYAFSSY